MSDRQKVLDYIRINDKGKGVAIDELPNCGLTKEAVEIVVNELCKEGEIFECRAGHVKVL